MSKFFTQNMLNFGCYFYILLQFADDSCIYIKQTLIKLDKMLYCASDLIESYILSICMFMVWVYVQSFYSIGN